MNIEEIQTASTEVLEALGRLVPQLSASALIVDMRHLDSLVRDSSSRLLIAREPDEAGQIVGMGTLATYRTPTGMRAVIEDVVVDNAFRGRGIGEALLDGLVRLAEAAGAAGVALTSNPRRTSANRLYLKVGFRRRQTNNYYFDFGRTRGGGAGARESAPGDELSR